MARKPLPLPTLQNLIPVSDEHRYFENFADQPFQASDTSFSIVNVWWLAEMSFLVYGDEEFVRNRLTDSSVSRGRLKSFRFASSKVSRAVTNAVADSDRFAIVAFREHGSTASRTRS